MILKVFDTVFPNCGFKKPEIQKTFSGGSTVRTFMYIRDPLEVLREEIYVLECNEDFIFRHVEKKLKPTVLHFNVHLCRRQNFWSFIKRQTISVFI